MKRKLLISVLAIALVLTLSLGVLAACDKDPGTTEYTVTYSLGEYTEGTAPAAQKVEAGSKVKLPAGVTRDGYTFAGWKADGGELLQPETEVEVNADITYVAQWTKNAPKVTVYGADGAKLGEKIAVEYEEGTYQISDPAQDYSSIKAPKGQYVTYQLYDPATQQLKGAFDLNSFQADGDISIKVVYENVGTVATELPAALAGYYALETPRGDAYTAEVLTGEYATITLNLEFHGEQATVLGTIAGQNIWTKDGAYILCLEESVTIMDDDDPTAAPTTETYYQYFSLALSQDGNTLTVSCLTDPFEGPYELAKMPEVSVTVYGPDGNQLGTEPLKATHNGIYYSIINPIMENELEAPEGSYYSIQLYDPTTQETKGAFDFKQFQANGNISIKLVIVTLSEDTAESSIDAKWYGNYIFESKTGTLSTVEITNRNIRVYFDIHDVNGTPTETLYPNGTTMFKSIWLKDGSYIVGEQHDTDPEQEGNQLSNAVYYALTLSEDGNTLTVSNLSDLEEAPYYFTRKSDYNVTVYYMLGDEEKTATMKTESVSKSKSYKLADPFEGSLDQQAIDDAYYLLYMLEPGDYYKYYYYDETASDHKGAEIDITGNFEFSADIAIIIVKESVGTVATEIDDSWFGLYTFTDMYGQQTLEIADGLIILNDSTIGTIEDGYILNGEDGKLILAQEFYSGGYTYYYFSKKENNTIEMELNGNKSTFAPCDVTVTIYYAIGETIKSKVVPASATGDRYELSEMPDYYIPEYNGDYQEFMSSFVFGSEFKYYYYTDGQKGKEYDPYSDTFEGSTSILVEIVTFADPVTAIDAKYDGEFKGTLGKYPFILIIDTTAGTIKLDFGEEMFPVEASIKGGAILSDKASDQLMFTSDESQPSNASYYYIKEEGGKLSLVYSSMTVELTKLSYTEYANNDHPLTVQYGLFTKTDVVINKVYVSTEYEVVKILVTVNNETYTLYAAAVEDQTEWWNTNQAGSDKQAEKAFEGFDFTYSGNSLRIDGIAIFSDGTLVLLKDTAEPLEPLTDHKSDVNLYTKVTA